MGKGDKDSLVTKTDISIYKCLLESKELCQKELSEKTRLKETSISRRFKKIDTFKFLNKYKPKGKNQNNYSIKKRFISKIKNLVELFRDI